MINQTIILLLAIHLVLALLYTLLIFTGKSYLHKPIIILIILVPLFGILMAIYIDMFYKLGRHPAKPIDMEARTLGEHIYWETIKGTKGKSDIVPLEEAILINDFRKRRETMLDALYDDPIKYLDILMVARENDDLETSHYANTTLAEIQRSYQLQIQKAAVAFEKNPEDTDLLDSYLEALSQFIKSGLSEDYLLNRQRIISATLLDKKLSKIENDKETLIKKLRNAIELGEFGTAYEVSNILKRYWPEDEQTWIEILRLCVDGQDKDRLQEAIADIRKSDIDWTKPGLEQVSLWVEGQKNEDPL